jgi:allophanate hydrolase subunit 2
MTDRGLIDVREPGLQTTVQDYPGRIGLWRVGIPPSGPMDSLAFRLANLLVGNAAGAAALEIQFTGPTLAFHAESTFALTGPGCDATLDGQAIPLWQTVRVRHGQVLRCPLVRNGARLYLAVCGGI